MTETSGFYTTDAVSPEGHQVSSYTQTIAAKAWAILAACGGKEGVAPGYLNMLVGSVPGANTARIGTGGAVVDGQWYENGAAVDVTIPSAAGGGNTRIDRIVLRITWASFQCVITRIAGTDAASPVAPAITQTPGTVYDIMLYQALVNTSGTVTLTNEMVMASLFHATRQGDSATIWQGGGNTKYELEKFHIEIGAAEWTGGAADNGSVEITNSGKFANPPMYFVTVGDSNIIAASIAASGADTATIYWHTVDGSTKTAVNISWLAIGETE